MFKKEIKNYNLDIYEPSFTSDIIGFASIALVFMITLLIALRWRSISQIIFVALIVRVILMLIGHFFFHLPDSTNDALGFEWGAWNMAKDGFINTLKNYPGANSFFYSWMIAIPYSLFGRSILMMQSIGITSLARDEAPMGFGGSASMRIRNRASDISFVLMQKPVRALSALEPRLKRPGWVVTGAGLAFTSIAMTSATRQSPASCAD